MDVCAFCDVVAYKSSAHRVFEDDQTLAFLDQHPINPGHLLVIPKRHVADFYELDDRTYGHLMSIVRTLGAAVAATVHPKKVGLIVAGFDVPHTHVHVVPMHDYHDITSKAFYEGTRTNPTHEEQADIAARFREYLQRATKH
jgi:histidine triad (HIT) family protein